MKILMVTTTYSPSLNGVAISTYRTVQELRRKKHRVTVIMPHHPQRKKKHPDDIELPALPNPIQKDYPIPVPARFSIPQLAKKRFDIVHFHQPVLIDVLAQSIAKDQNIPLVFTYHTRYEDYAKQYASFLPKKFLSQIVKAKIQTILNRCDGLIATTQTYQQQLQKTFQKPVFYVSTAGLTKRMKVRVSKQTLRQHHQIPLDKTVLLNVSRQVPEKNLPLIIKTFALLPTKYFLVMVGGGISTEPLKKLSQQLKVNSRVLFTGPLPQENLPDWFSLADFFIYSSKTDTIGINILEALSAGLPVFAVQDPNVAEVIKHGSNGFVLPAKPKAFAKAIQQFPWRRYASFSRQATTSAHHFLISETTKQLVEVYKTIIANKHV